MWRGRKRGFGQRSSSSLLISSRSRSSPSVPRVAWVWQRRQRAFRGTTACAPSSTPTWQETQSSPHSTCREWSNGTVDDLVAAVDAGAMKKAPPTRSTTSRMSPGRKTPLAPPSSTGFCDGPALSAFVFGSALSSARLSACATEGAKVPAPLIRSPLGGIPGPHRCPVAGQSRNRRASRGWVAKEEAARRCREDAYGFLGLAGMTEGTLPGFGQL